MSDHVAGRGEFLTALLVHDISNYNQTSRGYLEMLMEEQMGSLTEEQLRALTICLRQATRIQSLIESVQLLEEIAQTSSTLETLDLDEAIRDAISFVQSESAEREIRVRFFPANRKTLAEPCLGTMFRHLLSNSIRHNNSEIVEVDITVNKKAGEGGRNHWLIQIQDNGEGIPENRRDSLFFRLDQQNMHGHGIGLSLVKKLALRWGGDITLEPAAAEPGATFTLALPMI
jgi:two-component system, LuxR family, sensor kinase FixL